MTASHVGNFILQGFNHVQNFLQCSILVSNESLSSGSVDSQALLLNLVAQLSQVYLGIVVVEVLLVEELPLAVLWIISINHVVVETIGNASRSFFVVGYPVRTMVKLYTTEFAFYVSYSLCSTIFIIHCWRNTDGVLVVANRLDVPKVAGWTVTSAVDETTLVRS